MLKRSLIWGGLFVLFVGVLFFGSLSKTHAGNGITDGKLLKSPKHTSIYLFENGKRHAFPNSEVYFTWYTDFSNIETISVAEMESIELGNPMLIKAGTKLLKFPLNPKIYVVSDDGTINHIPDGATAKKLYGDNWENNIIELPEIYYLFYTKGSAVDSEINLMYTDMGLTFTCPSGMAAKSYTNYGFGVCHDPDGAMTGFESSVIFSVKSGIDMSDFPGTLTMIDSGYDTVQDYIDFLDFPMAQMPLTEKNQQGVEYNSFPGGTSDSMNYHVIIQNPDTQKIYHFSYPQSGTDLEVSATRDFMDGFRDTFRFLK